MYAVYNYKAGSTQAQVLADLIAILTGTTNVPSLSASCVQANTSILATVPAGWTLHDAAAGVNAQVVRALNQDGSTTKYFGLCASTSASFLLTAFEAWNAGTHAGTNGVPANTVTASGASLVWDAAGGGYFYIYASQKNVVIMAWTTAGYQLISGAISELTRETIPAGYPCHAILSGNSNAFTSVMSTNASHNMSRIKIANAAGDLTTTALLNTFLSGGVGLTSANQLTNAQTYRDAAEAGQIAIYKWGVAGSTAQIGFQLQGLMYDLYLTGASGTSNLDEISIGGTTYVIFKGNSANVALLVPKA